MKFIFKWTFRLIFAVVILFVGTLLARNVIVREIIEWKIYSQTGMDARIGYLDLGLLTPSIRIEDLKVYYPHEIGGVTLMEVPEFYLEYDRASLLRWHLRIPHARLNIKEVNVMEGQFRLPSARDLPQPPPAQPASSPSSLPAFDGIDRLELTFGTMKFSSQRSGSQTRELTVGLKDYPLTRVRSFADLTWQLLPVLVNKGVLTGQ